VRADVEEMNAAAALKPSAKRGSDARPGVVDSESDRAAPGIAQPEPRFSDIWYQNSDFKLLWACGWPV
jgi:hypothetical protein